MDNFYGKKLYLYLLLALLVAGTAFGQETTGAIRGEVSDPTGAIIPGATVEISGPGLMRAQTQKTDASGTYNFLTLPPGVYAVSTSAQGFASVKRVNIDLQVGKTLRVDFRLEVSTATQTVEVISEAAIVDVSQSTVAANVTATSFDRLPKTRGFSSLIALAPGARKEDKAGGYQVDGASGSENVYVIDGMDQTNIYSGTLPTSGNIPTEFVQELQVKSSGFQAEYGGAMGGVINVVTKSGSNDFHGDIGLYLQTDSMQARPRPTLDTLPEDDFTAYYLQNQTDDFRYLNPGFTIGGPMVKNKLWFFAGYYPELRRWER
ncbi:MAG TPA: TonB-dependent receptor, partial [Bryobacteraceae bacterium]|nr:TonB-dependent receptor [Bryobacteraceae bacterium]